MTLPRQALLILLALGMVPAAGQAQCKLQQPQRAEIFLASLVPAFAPCEPSSSIAKDGPPACEPVALTDGRGWVFDPSAGHGNLELRVIDAADGTEQADLLIALQLSGMREGDEPAAGQGILRLRPRLTLDHPQRGDLTPPGTACNFNNIPKNGSQDHKSMIPEK